MPSSPPDPLVSVLMPAYQHGRFVRQAVASVLEQRTPFPVELIVSDDASPDRSGEIIAALASSHPDRIRFFQQPLNLGAAANVGFLFAQARGRYVALLESDDYWTYPEKLARQVALLEADRARPASSHFATIVDDHGTITGEAPSADERRSEIDFQIAVAANPMPTASLVFRRELMPRPPAWAAGLYMLDWPFWVELASYGTIQVFPENWSAYRMHPGGMWTGTGYDRRLRANLDFYDRVERHFPAARHSPAARQRKFTLYQLFRLADMTDDRAQARRWLWCYLRSKPSPWRLPRHQARAISRSLVGWPKLKATPS